MKVEMKIKIQGSRNGIRWPEAGGIADLPDNEAADLCAQGFADPIAEPAKVEKRPTKKPEKR